MTIDASSVSNAVAGLPAITGVPCVVGVPAVAVISSVACAPAVSGIPVVAGVTAVAGALAIALILLHPYLDGIFYAVYCMYIVQCGIIQVDYRTKAIRLLFFLQYNYRISDQGLNLSDYRFSGSQKTLGCQFCHYLF